jgi:Ca2+-binding RTX toxin-like protein
MAAVGAVSPSDEGSWSRRGVVTMPATIVGTALNNVINGTNGRDVVGASDDSLRGDNGRDTCVSGEVSRSSCEL